VSDLRNRLRDVLFGPECGARLLTVHTGFAVLIGARIAFGPYRGLASTPDELFDPVAVLGWMSGMPSSGTIVLLQVVGVGAALAAAFRKQPRVAFAVAWLCLLVLAGLRGSRGKVLHNDLLLVWAAVPFLLAPLHARWGDRRPRRDIGWPVRSSMAIVATIYALAGYHKLQTSGIDWAIGDNVRYVLLWGSPVGSTWESLSGWVADHAWAYRGTGAFILGVEVTFPLALLWRRIQPWFAVAAVSLHLATYLFLGLDYWAWMVAVVLLFVDWPSVVDRVRRTAPTASTTATASAVP
jgi:hypothetical protein